MSESNEGTKPGLMVTSSPDEKTVSAFKVKATQDQSPSSKARCGMRARTSQDVGLKSRVTC